MSQFRIIADIAESMKELLRSAFVEAGFRTVSVGTEVPKKDNIKNKPAVNCYMYHVGFAPNYKERTRHLVSTQDRDGNLVEYYQDAPVYLYANFAISVWGNTPMEENLLLGLVIKTFLETPMIGGERLKGEAFMPDESVNVHPNLSTDYNDVLSFWRSLGEEVRPVVYYHVKFRIESERRSDDIRRVLGKDLAVRGAAPTRGGKSPAREGDAPKDRKRSAAGGGQAGA